MILRERDEIDSSVYWRSLSQQGSLLVRMLRPTFLPPEVDSLAYLHAIHPRDLSHSRGRSAKILSSLHLKAAPWIPLSRSQSTNLHYADVRLFSRLGNPVCPPSHLDPSEWSQARHSKKVDLRAFDTPCYKS